MFGLADAVAVAEPVLFAVDVAPPVRTINEFVVPVPVAVPLDPFVVGNAVVLVSTVLVVEMEVYVRPEGSTPSPDSVPVTPVPLITVTDWANTALAAKTAGQHWRSSILGKVNMKWWKKCAGLETSTKERGKRPAQRCESSR